MPGLLATTLEEAGIAIAAAPARRLAGADRRRPRRARSSAPARCRPGICRGRQRRRSAGRLRCGARRPARRGSGDLLIAIERPPPERDLLAIGIAGERLRRRARPPTRPGCDGYVLATDLLPTILERSGSRSPARSTGSRSPRRAAPPTRRRSPRARRGSARSRAARGGDRDQLRDLGRGAARAGAHRPPRLAGAAARRRSRRRWRSCRRSCCWPRRSSRASSVERLIVGAGAPLLAALAIAALRPRLGGAPRTAPSRPPPRLDRRLRVDVVAGSPLTALSLLGPNPALGVRFFGIGNELEATVGALLLLAVGAAITALAPRDPAPARSRSRSARGRRRRGRSSSRRAASAPTSAPRSRSRSAPRRGRRRPPARARGKAALVIAAPLAALALLVVVDLVIPAATRT